MTRAQRALHELEIYKTPLLPTRLRNGVTQASITGVPDLFKPRRNKLLLIKDEKQSSDRKLGQKEAILSEKNGTKPYAGAGDMKKMLVKRKLELEGEDLEEASEETNKVEEDVVIEEEADLRPSTSSKEIPPLKDDWYSLATVSSSAAGGSSLRVGRAKSSRNHISRPMARSRTKFSAAFDDEGDDTMVEQDKERTMLEEAVKKAPVFEIPAGFSFSKDVSSSLYQVMILAYVLLVGETDRARYYQRKGASHQIVTIFTFCYIDSSVGTHPREIGSINICPACFFCSSYDFSSLLVRSAISSCNPGETFARTFTRSSTIGKPYKRSELLRSFSSFQ